MRGAARAIFVLGLTLAACGGPAESFSPDGPCGTDGRIPGAYPELEAKLPLFIGGISGGLGAVDGPATLVDSGRNCTEPALGSLWGHGVRELRFAGATWDFADGNATVSALFVTPTGQPALEPGWLEEFYELGARASTKTENVEVTRPAIEPAGDVFRLDALNGLSLQTVVVWPDADEVRVVIVATNVNPDASREFHEARVRTAVMQSASATDP